MPAQELRTTIYPHNIKKAEDLAKSMNNISVTELVNFLIETVDIQQMTKLTFNNKNNGRSTTKILRTGDKYEPDNY